MATPSMLHYLPSGVLVQILLYLDVREVLRVRQTCWWLCKMTLAAEVWELVLLRWLSNLRIPRDAFPIPQMNEQQLEETYSAHRRFQSLLKEFGTIYQPPTETLPPQRQRELCTSSRFNGVRLSPGGRFLFTLRGSELQCWDLEGDEDKIQGPAVSTYLSSRDPLSCALDSIWYGPMGQLRIAITDTIGQVGTSSESTQCYVYEFDQTRAFNFQYLGKLDGGPSAKFWPVSPEVVAFTSQPSLGFWYMGLWNVEWNTAGCWDEPHYVELAWNAERKDIIKIIDNTHITSFHLPLLRPLPKNGRPAIVQWPKSEMRGHHMAPGRAGEYLHAQFLTSTSPPSIPPQGRYQMHTATMTPNSKGILIRQRAVRSTSACCTSACQGTFHTCASPSPDVLRHKWDEHTQMLVNPNPSVYKVKLVDEARYPNVNGLGLKGEIQPSLVVFPRDKRLMWWMSCDRSGKKKTTYATDDDEWQNVVVDQLNFDFIGVAENCSFAPWFTDTRAEFLGEER
ncbi:hypothetical protein DL96DRAFT_1677625 [Flagelloscypha sp. PMI_526]|nr:hypothetical protein DL96DRAFT_1677625 [Flagelloscypha sp. PMI_526]